MADSDEIEVGIAKSTVVDAIVSSVRGETTKDTIDLHAIGVVIIERAMALSPLPISIV
jgi:hypothetical protein